MDITQHPEGTRVLKLCKQCGEVVHFGTILRYTQGDRAKYFQFIQTYNGKLEIGRFFQKHLGHEQIDIIDDGKYRYNKNDGF